MRRCKKLRRRWTVSKIHAGLKIGKLTVTEKRGRSNDGHQIWACLCECGTTVERTSNNLSSSFRRNVPSNCGCVPSIGGFRHGKRKSPEYGVWQGIKARCLNESNKDYRRYGPLGMDAGWADDFMAFYDHVGGQPSADMQIDRIDTNVGYFPGNVRWVSVLDQARNKTNCYVWFIDGKMYETCQEVADAYERSLKTAYGWFVGVFDKRRGSYTPPKNGCIRLRRYE